METSRSATTEPVKQEDWENPEIQRIGTEPARGRAFFAFPDRDRAMQNQPLDSGWMISLGGIGHSGGRLTHGAVRSTSTGAILMCRSGAFWKFLQTGNSTATVCQSTQTRGILF